MHHSLRVLQDEKTILMITFYLYDFHVQPVEYYRYRKMNEDTSSSIYSSFNIRGDECFPSFRHFRILIFHHIFICSYCTHTLLYLFSIIIMVLQSLLITRTVLRSIHRITTAKQFHSSSISSNKTSPVSVRLYRILLHQLQQLPPHKSILLQPALFSSDYGKVKHFQDPTLNKRDEPAVSHILRTFQQWNKDNSQIQTWFHSLQDATQQEQSDHQDNTLESEEEHTVTCWTTRQELQDAIRYAFQHTPPGVAMQGVAIQAVQALTEQVALWACTSTSHNTTHGIRIVATSGYVKECY